MIPQFDNSSGFTNGGVPTDVYEWDHLSSGSRRALVVSLQNAFPSDDAVGVTCDGDAMTLIQARDCGINGWLYTYIIVGQASGTNHIVATFSNALYVRRNIALSYKLVNQGTPVDTFDGADAEDGSSSLVSTLTSTIDGCVMVIFGGGQRSPTFDADGVFRTSAEGDGSFIGGDKGASTSPAGDTTITLLYASIPASAIATIFLALVPPDPELIIQTDAASDVVTHGATANGELLVINTDEPDLRGFVFGTSSQSDPGDVAPDVSGYDDFEEESGSFTPGPFSAPLTGLIDNTTYYFRVFAHDDAGYVYGEELTFTTVSGDTFRFTNLPGIVYDEDDTTTIFAERLNRILDRLDVLEP